MPNSRVLFRSLTATLTMVAFLACLPVYSVPLCEVDTDLGQELNLPVYRWMDSEEEQRALILALHGVTLYGACFDDLGSFLAEKGYPVYALDIRGFGKWRTANERFAGNSEVHFTRTIEDVIEILKKLRLHNPDKKLFCMGESLGANLSLWLASVHPELVDGAILSAPCIKRHVRPRPRWLIDVIKGLAGPNKEMTVKPYMSGNLTHSPALTARCLNDPRMRTDLSPVELIKATITNKRTIKAVEQIPDDMPLLILAGENDRLYKSAAIPSMVARMGSDRTEVKIFPGKGHLLLEHQTVDPEISSIIHTWLESNHRKGKDIANAATPATGVCYEAVNK